MNADTDLQKAIEAVKTAKLHAQRANKGNLSERAQLALRSSLLELSQVLTKLQEVAEQ